MTGAKVVVIFQANTYPDSALAHSIFRESSHCDSCDRWVNPSSGEFRPDRNWNAVQNAADWKRRLKNYFNQSTPRMNGSRRGRVGLALLGLDYGTEAPRILTFHTVHEGHAEKQDDERQGISPDGRARRGVVLPLVAALP